MNYHIHNTNKDEPLIKRILKAKNIHDNYEDFLNPTFGKYRIPPSLLSDIDKACERIQQAIKNKEKIMIFGDYDVDGVTSSAILYKFFRHQLNYNHISVMFPHRLHDGYGLKKHHIDSIEQKGVSLIITVDNGITSIEEALYTQQKKIDLIITDHHKNLEKIPEAYAVINPHTSPNYGFKGICGAGVAFKLIVALMEKMIPDRNKRISIFNHLLPYVAIATIADCVPLTNENRVIVKQGLNLLNNQKENTPGLKNFLNFMNINKVDTFHVGFLIAPRINAGGRIKTPYESLYALLYEGEKQQQYLALLDSLNEERKKLQEEAFKKAQEMINPQASILIAGSETFHEGIIGIVAGKLTEKLRRPSMIYYINKEKNIAVASLRGPEYFSVIDMIKSIDHLLIKYGGHQQAGGLTCSLENLENVIQSLEGYCNTKIKPEQFHKIIHVDTCLYGNERSYENQNHIEKLGPFGNGNEEPILKIETDKILKTETVGKKQNHIKIITESEKQVIEILFWGGKEKIDHANIHDGSSMIGKRKKDNYGKLYVDGIHCFHD